MQQSIQFTCTFEILFDSDDDEGNVLDLQRMSTVMVLAYADFADLASRLKKARLHLNAVGFRMLKEMSTDLNVAGILDDEDVYPPE